MVNLVTQKPIEAMVSELRNGRVISKEQILKESEFPGFLIQVWYLREQCATRPKIPMRL